MPNGLGMGGQLEYFGFWIDAEFGIVRTSPSCSTFHSPQLGVQVISPLKQSKTGVHLGTLWWV